MDEPIPHLPEKEQVELFIIDEYPEVGEPCMFGKGYLYVYFLLFVLCYGYIYRYFRVPSGGIERSRPE